MDRKNKKQNKRKVGRIALLGLLFLVVLASWRLPETFTPHEGLATPLSAAAAGIGGDGVEELTAVPVGVTERARDAERVNVTINQEVNHENVQIITAAQAPLPGSSVATSVEIAEARTPVWQGVYASGTPGFGGGGGTAPDFTRHALVDEVIEVYTPSFAYISSTTTEAVHIDPVDITQIFPCSE